MTDEPALLAAIRANPDEDTVRLEYADWLEENRRVAEADAIRRGCRKPKWFTFGEGKPAVASYTTARSDLPRVVEVRLAEGIPGLQWVTCRGLVAGVRCRAAVWFLYCDEILARHPVRRVTWTTFTEAEVTAFWHIWGAQPRSEPTAQPSSLAKSYTFCRLAGLIWPGVEFDSPGARWPDVADQDTINGATDD